MAQTKRRKVAKHVLVLDTNILWHDDKADCVSPKFQQFWDKNANQYDIILVLPEVVFGELRFQQTTSALKALAKANVEFQKISSIAAGSYSHRVTAKKVNSDVEKKLNIWAHNINCQIHPSPVDSIDWKKLIQDAIWRNPPFIEDKKTEKGFRDAIIIETTLDIADKYHGIDLAFISSDKLLLEAAQSRLGEKCSCYETIEEFETYLNLLEEKLTNEFVRSIQSRARTKFHSEGDKDCLISREKLISLIREQNSALLSPPVATAAGGLLSGLIDPKNKWVSETGENVWVRAPEFIRLEGANEFHWRSRIIFVELFKYHGTQSGSLLTGLTTPGDEKLQKVVFPVKWKSKVAKNGRFMSVDFSGFEEPEKLFELITDEERKLYDIPLELDVMSL